MNKARLPVFGAVFAALGLLLSAAPARAVTIVPRDTSNPYQKNPHARVKRVMIRHDDQVWQNGQKALFASMRRLSGKYGFQLDSIRPGDQARPREFSDSAITGVDVLVLFLSQQDPDTSEATRVMERHLYERGGAVLLLLESAAYKTCPNEDLSHAGCTFLARAAARQYSSHEAPGNAFRLYVDSVKAGEVPPHGSPGTVPVPPAATRAHGISNPETRAIFQGLPRVWTGLGDAWYSFRSSPRLVGETPRRIRNLDSALYVEGAVNVLVSVDEESAVSNTGSRATFLMGDHPVSWTRKMGKGLSAFVSMGAKDVYPLMDSVAERYHWRLMRYLARDFMGCMDPSSPRYNPEATVAWLTDSDSADPCAEPASLGEASRAAPRVRVTSRGASLRIALPGPETRAVRVLDVSGRAVFARAGQGMLETPALPPGIYFVHVAAPDGAKSVARARVL
jgi:hypothetical protein